MWAQIANGGYRRARKTVLAWWRPDRKPRPAELHAAVAAAAEQAAAWRHASTDGPDPKLPVDLAGAEGAFGQLHTEMTALADWACIPDIGQLSIIAFQAKAQALVSDAETLYRLPGQEGGAGLNPCFAPQQRTAVSGRRDQPPPPHRRPGSCLSEQVWLSSILESACSRTRASGLRWNGSFPHRRGVRRSRPRRHRYTAVRYGEP